MNCYAYFEPIGFLVEYEVIEHWKRTWGKHGWNPILLSHDDAVKYPRFNEYNEAVAKFPTVNPKEYEMACFKRWAAMAALGGGVMCDYDVMNYGFRPMDLMNGDLSLVFYESNGVPSCVSGAGYLFDIMCQQFAAYKPNDLDAVAKQAHISDQDICCRRFTWLPLRTHRVVRQFRDHGFDEAPLVHFTNASTGGHHAKIEAIRNYRREPVFA